MISNFICLTTPVLNILKEKTYKNDFIHLFNKMHLNEFFFNYYLNALLILSSIFFISIVLSLAVLLKEFAWVTNETFPVISALSLSFSLATVF